MKEILMKKSVKLLYLGALCVLGTLATALRCAALLTGFDFESGYFTDKLLNTVSVIALVLAAVLFSTVLFIKSRVNPRLESGTEKDFITSAVVGVTLFLMAFECAFAKRTPSTPSGGLNIARYLPTLASILAAAAVFYFLFTVVKAKRTSRTNALFSMAVSLFLAFYAITLYFDTSSPINAPVKLCDQLCYAFLAVFFLYEARVALARPMHRPYIATGLFAATFAAYSSIPSVICYLVRGETVSTTLSENALTLALFAYCLIRVVTALCVEEDKENRVVTLIRKMSDERKEEIKATALTRAQNINNEENETEESDNYEIELPTVDEKGTEEES